MIIRDEQRETFSKNLKEDFVNRMVIHIRKFFPEHFKALEEEQTRELIEYGIEKAKPYDIISERDVCKFIDLMVVFGPDFDTDPKYPWASEILNDKDLKNPRYKTNVLFDAGMKELKEQ